MPTKSLATNDAPPIKPPSTSSQANNSAALLALLATQYDFGEGALSQVFPDTEIQPVEFAGRLEFAGRRFFCRNVCARMIYLHCVLVCR